MNTTRLFTLSVIIVALIALGSINPLATPEEAVISVDGTPYSQTALETIDRLLASGARTRRTDEQEVLAFYSNGSTYPLPGTFINYLKFLPLVVKETPEPLPPVSFAVIGDYGTGEQPEEDVANLILSWDVDFIITTGDNNYPYGEAETIDDNIGRYYHSYIYPYKGEYGESASTIRFFPTLGNHDLVTNSGEPYFDYFELPGNERYYDFVWGPVHLFALNSNSSEPDGVTSNSTQANWLREVMTASTTPWQVVYTHHPPYSSGPHGSTVWMLWPYEEWGADVVMAGHDHTYERLLINDIPYFVNGLGGRSIYNFNGAVDGSVVRFNRDYGAMLVHATSEQIIFRFITRTGEVVDQHVINALP